MFVDLMPLFPSEKGIAVLTVSKVSETHLRVSVHPHADNDADKPGFSPVAFEGTPEELDGRVDFSPLIEAESSIATAIKAAADKRKEDGLKKAVEEAKKPAPPPATTTTRRGRTPTAAAAPAAVPVPVADAEAKAKADAEVRAKAEAEAKANDAKRKRDDEVARLKAQLAALETGGELTLTK